MTSTELNSSLRTGVTPQLKFNFLHAFMDVVMPIMSTGQRKRLTIRTVFPESELMTIPFAFVSIAIAQVACDMASVLSFILYSVVLKRFA